VNTPRPYFLPFADRYHWLWRELSIGSYTHAWTK